MTWLLALLISLAFCRIEKWRRRIAWAALVIAAVFTNPLLYHVVSNAWEPEPLPLDSIESPYDDAVVLGGFTRLYATPIDRLHLSRDPNRFTQAVELYQQGKVKRLVFVSGGTASAAPHPSEAELAARTAARFGVPTDAIVALSTSRNTRENATEYRSFVESQEFPGGSPSTLLITSAFHARRASGCFQRAGVEFTLFPTDHRTERDHENRRLSLSNTVVPSPGTIFSWGSLLREWFGMLVYRLRGWI